MPPKIRPGCQKSLGLVLQNFSLANLFSLQAETNPAGIVLITMKGRPKDLKNIVLQSLYFKDTGAWA